MENNSFFNKFNSSLSELWEKDKVFLLCFGLLILVVKFRSVLISLIVANSKKLLEDTKTADTVLQKQENDYKKKADALVQEAKNLPNTKENVDEDWYKK